MNKIFITILFGFISSITYAQNIAPPEHSAYWNELTDSAKQAYIYGVIDGVYSTYESAGVIWLPEGEFYDHMFKRKDSERVQSLSDKVSVKLEPNKIIEIMNHLYADPSNTYISRIEILYFARDKALGENITEQMARARKKAIEDWDLLTNYLKKMKNNNKTEEP